MLLGKITMTVIICWMQMHHTHVYIVGIYVVRMGVSLQQLQSDTSVIVCGVKYSQKSRSKVTHTL